MKEQNEKKAIEELAKVLDKAKEDALATIGSLNRGWGTWYAEAVYNAGYRKQSAWISVDERLPDDCGMPVLMVAVNEYGKTNVVKGFTDYAWPITFHTNEKEYCGTWKAWKVTHWMPLPEPPMMKGGEQP